MAHYGMLKGSRVFEAGEDIRGASLYGLNDEKLGKIDDVIFDHATAEIRYAVVDTGGWLSTKKFIVPVEHLRVSSKHEDDFEANLTKQQIENFPPYQESDLDSEREWSEYEGRYRSKWVSDPVMHRAETDRNVTPTTKQVTRNLQSETAAARAHGEPVSTRSGLGTKTGTMTGSDAADVAAATSPTGRIVPAGTDAVVISSSAVGIGGRWDTFQSRLRERRKEAVADCPTCTGSAPKRESESAGTLRKAV